jgi:hypothetical protein
MQGLGGLAVPRCYIHIANFSCFGKYLHEFADLFGPVIHRKSDGFWQFRGPRIGVNPIQVSCTDQMLEDGVVKDGGALGLGEDAFANHQLH